MRLLPKSGFRVSAFLLLLVAGTFWVRRAARAQFAQPLVSEDTLTRVSDHVYALVGYPNIGVVVGTRGTLVVDTGMGARNGATAARVAQKLAKGPNLYLTTTHFHPEHSTGEQAFPANTVIIRNAAQQEEMDERIAGYIERFRDQSVQNKELLQNVELRAPDIVFDHQVKIDLGGVAARLFWLGPAHTKGDELIFVEQDSVLLPGDIVQNKIFPIMPDDHATMKGWLARLDEVEAIHPRLIVPDHGPLGDTSLIAQQRSMLLELQKRALELKRQGVPVDDAGKMMLTEFQTKYPDWMNSRVIPNVAKRVYAEGD